MSREVTFLDVCDVCAKKGLDVEATFSDTARVGGIQRKIDLCDKHKKPVIAVKELLAAFGQTVKQAQAIPDGYKPNRRPRRKESPPEQSEDDTLDTEDDTTEGEAAPEPAPTRRKTAPAKKGYVKANGTPGVLCTRCDPPTGPYVRIAKHNSDKHPETVAR